MMLPFDDVYEAALALPRSERAELIELLVAGLSHDDESEFEFPRRVEWEEFPAESVAGSGEMIPWDEVRRRVSARLTSDE
jgi:hypothetical protein